MLVSSIKVLEPQDNYVTNQPIQTFKINTQYSNPFSEKNRLTFHVTDEGNNETVTELDPSSLSQIISLSEGINSYWFELVDSTGIVEKSLSRKIILNTTKPFLELTSPNENELIGVNDKVVVSGIVEDELFDLISYRVNSGGTETKISNDDLEDLGDNKKAFNFVIDPNILGNQIDKVEIIAKDKAGNITSEEINIENDRRTKLLSKEIINSATIIRNDGASHQIKQGEPFQFSTTANICDDLMLKGSDYQSKLIISSNSYTINGTENKTTYQNNPDGITTFVPGAAGLLNGCATQDNIFYSGVFNSNNSINELFLPTSLVGNPTLYWPIGKYTIEQTLTAAPQSATTYGTTFENNSLSTMVSFLVEITRNITAEITALKPQNLLWNKENNITFNLNLYDSIPITDKDHLPIIGQAYIQTPGGTIDNVTLNCNPQISISYPIREITENCSFNYTPKELTKGSASYALTLPVSFSPYSGNLTDNRPSILAEYPDIKSNFEIAAKIIEPSEYTVIQSLKALIRSTLDKTKLPPELQSLSSNKIKNLAKYGIRFGKGKVRTITSNNNYDSVVKGISVSNIDQNTISFDYNLNFNLSTENNFKDAYENLSAFGPIYLYNEISSLDPQNTTFSYAEPQKLILLDKPSIKGTLKNNLKTNNKVLNLTIKNNASSYGPNSKTFPLELLVEPKDASGMILGNTGEFNTSVLIPKNSQSTTRKINNLPVETTEVLVTLKRSDNFLNFIQDKLNKNNFAFNIVNDEFKIISPITIKLSDSQVTSCSLNPDTANENDKVDLSYTLKSVKSVSVTTSGKKPDGTIDKLIQLPPELKNKTDWAKSGIITFTVPKEWGIYSEVIFTLISGDESDSCSLKIGSNIAFEINDPDTKIATYNGIIISVSELKDLLINLGLLNEAERQTAVYTQVTEDAWKIFIYLTKICKENNLKLQTVTGGTIQASCSYNFLLDENGNLIPLPDPNTLPRPEVKDIENISIWKEVLNGFVQSGVSNIKDIINPTSIGIITTIVLLTTTGLAASIAASVPVAVLALATYSTIGGLNLLNAKSIIDEVNSTYKDKPNAWKISYAIGRLQPDFTLIKGITGLVKNIRISEKVEKILAIDNGAYKETAEFIHEEQRLINKLDIAEEARNLKREKLDTYADSTYDKLVNNDQTKRSQVNNLHNELNKDPNMRADLQNNVIYKEYPKDLSNTLEDPQVIKEKIFKPTIEYGAEAEARGVENKFVFKSEFLTKDGSVEYSNFNLQDLQKQGFLLGDEISKDLLPPKVWRVINYRDDLNMLGGNGPVFTFFEEGLTFESITDELNTNRINFISKLGLKPNDFQGKLTLIEIDTRGSNFRFWKPTTKDAGFGKKNGFFRFNGSDEFGRALDVNSGDIGVTKELVTNDIVINRNQLPLYIKLKEIE